MNKKLPLVALQRNAITHRRVEWKLSSLIGPPTRLGHVLMSIVDRSNIHQSRVDFKAEFEGTNLHHVRKRTKDSGTSCIE